MRVFALLALVALSLAPAVHAGWTVEQPQMATVILGIACPTDNTCYAGAGQDGVGVVMFATDNGGKDWDTVPLDPETAQMMFMSTASQSPDTAVTIGMGFPPTQFGNLRGFRNSESFAVMAVSQNVGVVQGVRQGYGFAGDFTTDDGMEEGVGISTDGGKNFKLYSVPKDQLHGWSRYAAYPSPTHWMLSTGAWPTVSGDRITSEGSFMLNSRISVQGNQRLFVFDNQAPVDAAESSYRGGITITTDGGRTWRNVLKVDGTYLNQVKCVNTRTCFVVGEGNGKAVIMGTNNFGETWRTVWETQDDADLMGLELVSEREIWACGMRLRNNAIVGLFLHSVDGGVTWTEEQVPEYYCVDMSFSSRGRGKAAAIDRFGLSSILGFSA